MIERAYVLAEHLGLPLWCEDEEAPEGQRWQDWDPFPAAEQLDRFFPPLRLLLILDNLAGHYSRNWVRWCHEQGIGLLYTPCAGYFAHQRPSRSSPRRQIKSVLGEVRMTRDKA